MTATNGIEALASDILIALNNVPQNVSSLPHIKSWNEINENNQKHILVTVNVVAKSRSPLKVTLLKTRCKKCNLERIVTSGSSLTCRFCRGALEVIDTIAIEVRVGKIMTIDGEEIDAIFIGQAKDIKPGRRNVVAYLSWLPSKKGLEKPVLLILKEVNKEEQPKIDLFSLIQSASDWRERIIFITKVVADVFNIVGLRTHILMLLAQMVGAHGVVPFIDDLPVRKRWWIHATIIGDPGTGKSTLAEFVRKCTPHERCILLSGPSITLAGLTIGQALGYPCDGALLILDGGPIDFGVLIIEETHMMKLDILHHIKDALERGEFYRAIAGQPRMGGTCRVPLLLIANFTTGIYKGPNSLPEWLKDPAFSDRLDFILFTFEPTEELSKKIANRLFTWKSTLIGPADIAAYIEKCRMFTPLVEDPEEVINSIEEGAKILRAAYQDLGIYRSMARLRESIARLSIAVAKLALTNVTPDLVKYVVDILKSHLDAIIDESARYVQIHAVPASEYLIRDIVLEILQENKNALLTKEELIEKTCERLERQFYKCSEDKVDRVIQKLKHEGIIYEPEPGKARMVT